MNPIRRESGESFPCPKCGKMVQPTVEIDAKGTDTEECLNAVNKVDDKHKSTGELLTHPVFGTHPIIYGMRRVDCECGWMGVLMGRIRKGIKVGLCCSVVAILFSMYGLGVDGLTQFPIDVIVTLFMMGLFFVIGFVVEQIEYEEPRKYA